MIIFNFKYRFFKENSEYQYYKYCLSKTTFCDDNIDCINHEIEDDQEICEKFAPYDSCLPKNDTNDSNFEDLKNFGYSISRLICVLIYLKINHICQYSFPKIIAGSFSVELFSLISLFNTFFCIVKNHENLYSLNQWILLHKLQFVVNYIIENTKHILLSLNN